MTVNLVADACVGGVSKIEDLLKRDGVENLVEDLLDRLLVCELVWATVGDAVKLKTPSWILADEVTNAA